MPLTAADIKFFAAATQTDAADGGGQRSSTLVQNGLDNNLFPDVTAGDRTAGQTRLRKVYPSLTNTDNAALLSGALAMDSVPADADTTLVVFATGGAATTRAQAVTALSAWHDTTTTTPIVNVSYHSGAALHLGQSPGSPIPAVGQVVGVRLIGADDDDPNSYERAIILSVAVISGGFVWALTLDRPLTGAYEPTAGPTIVAYARYGMRAVSETRPYGVASAPAMTSGATTVTLSSASAKIVPYVSGAYPTVDRGFPPAPLAYSSGGIKVIRKDDGVTIWDEQATSPATATVSTVSTGRTNLDQLAVVGNNGVEIARFLKDGPTPTPTSGAMTADLAAGTVTFSSVAGFSQPVTIRHRIAHSATVTAVAGLAFTFSPALTRDFPASSRISSHLPLGDVQARAYNVFAQQAWTRVFSDTLIGSSVTLPYSATPIITNQGAETDRWAIVFTAGNTFDCYSEARGLIASGNTVANFSPINPATGAPFFTLLAASWAATILVGSVLRFNTDAAAPPVWALRCTVPGAGSGNSTAALRLLGAT